MEVNCLQAVSYTHLEGRDFQSVLQEIQAYLSKEYSNPVTGDGNEEIKAQIRRFAGKYIPVSYTHLDVYKRQGGWRKGRKCHY